MGREKTADGGCVTAEPSVQRFGSHSIQSLCSSMVGVDSTQALSRRLLPISVSEQTHLSTVILVVMLSVAIPVSAREGLDDAVVALEPDNQAVVDIGRGVYQSHCASCHGKQMEGQPEWRKRLENGMLPAPPHDKTGHTWHHADDTLFEITKYGVAKVIGDPKYLTMMPAFESILEDKEIIAVLSYIKSTWPAREREWQEKIDNASKNGVAVVNKKSWLERWLKW